ncbi:hypothetical protein HYT02_04030 [Candidatus Gottesmanbacteria bacterium]|nr:hypothetical protein [Candidatus Gottesmanbacteria bacterium]
MSIENGNGYKMTKHSATQLDRKIRVVPMELVKRSGRLAERKLGPIIRSPDLPISFTYLMKPEEYHVKSFADFDEIVLRVQADEGYRTNREPQV